MKLFLATLGVLSATQVILSPFQDEQARVAKAIVQELRAIQWNVRWSDWRQRHPEAPLQVFRRSGVALPIEDRWGYASEATAGKLFFYPFPNGDVPSCRLHQYRAEIAVGRLRASHRLLEAVLSAEYGRPVEPKAVSGWGAANWREIRRWRAKQTELTLFLEHERRQADPIKVVLIARSETLADYVAMNVRGELEPNADPLPSIDRELSRAIASVSPSASRLLVSVWESDRASKEQVIAAMETLLRRSPSLPLDVRPAALLAADRLAERLAPSLHDGTFSRQRNADLVRRMEALGLSVWWNELGASWSYTRPLLWRVWQEFPRSPWGEWAFLALLRAGWTTELCDGPRFQEVIREGEAFLRDRPGSPHLARVWFMLGLAFETWWSLSLASPDDPYVGAGGFAKGAEEARKKALDYYQKSAAALPASDMAAYVRWRSPRLELGIDTNCRYYYCVYD